MPDFATMRVNMVDTQIRPSDVTRYPVIAAMLEVPREVFVPPAFSAVAYVDQNVPLGAGRVVLDPRTLGKMLDALAIEPGDRALDLGSGSGYGAALMARMGAEVSALEEDGDLAETARSALAEADVAATGVNVVNGALTAGWPDGAPYDVILVSGGAVEEVPAAVTGQLREGGRIAALFIEGALGIVKLGHATSAGLVWRDLFNAHAPLMPGFARERAFAL